MSNKASKDFETTISNHSMLLQAEGSVPDQSHDPSSKKEAGNALGQKFMAAYKKHLEGMEKVPEGEGSKGPEDKDTGRYDGAN